MLQLIVNALVSAAIFTLFGVGFSIRLGSARFFDFSPAVLFATAGYIALWMSRTGWCSVGVACILALPVTGVIGAALEVAVFRPLRGRTGFDLLALIASLGVYTLGQNIISLGFGDGREALLVGARKEGLRLVSAHVTGIQLLMIGVAVLMLIMVYLFTKLTRRGLALRAVCINPQLAEFVGINRFEALVQASFVSAVIVASGGILYSLDVDMIPTMGIPMLVMAILVVITGGTMDFLSIGLVALLLSLTRHAAAWTLGARWMDSVACLVVLGFLLIRPGGVAGRSPHSASIVP